MSESIEKIWKNGLIADDALVAPKINNLYEQKSIHLIDQFKRMFRINLISIIIGSIAMLAGTFVMGIPLAGIPIFILLNILVIFGKKELNSLEKISLSDNSYHYIKAFDDWMKGQKELYSKLYGYFYPFFSLSIVFGVGFSNLGERLFEKFMLIFPSTNLVYGIPVIGIVLVIVITSLLAYFGSALYRFDFNLVYGRIMARFSELMSDMETLRK